MGVIWVFSPLFLCLFQVLKAGTFIPSQTLFPHGFYMKFNIHIWDSNRPGHSPPWAKLQSIRTTCCILKKKSYFFLILHVKDPSYYLPMDSLSTTAHFKLSIQHLLSLPPVLYSIYNKVILLDWCVRISLMRALSVPLLLMGI